MKKTSRFLLELADSIIVALVAVMVVFTLVCRIYVVDGESMNNTLSNNDRLLVSNLFYTPEQGDIVCFLAENNNSKVLVKRVIATAGQTVDINAQYQVTVDGKLLDESYLQEYVTDNRGTHLNITSPKNFQFPYTVQEGEVFCMGDNRTNSKDSRDLGAIPTEYILGRSLVRLAPKFGAVK